MQKRVIIVHGWESNPEDCWFPWIKKELSARGFEVVVPQFPHPEAPEIKSWVEKLNEVVGTLDASTYFMGHSIGCQTILRYLEKLLADNQVGGLARHWLSPQAMVGGAVFVAGWFNLLGLKAEEEKKLADPWLNTPIDFIKIKKVLPKSVAIFSDNDEFVPLNDRHIFEDKLGSKIVVEHNRGHFDRGNKIFELPSALDAIIDMSD